MRKILFVYSFLLFLVASASAQFQKPDEGFQQASDQNKPVLLYFSGSDWCEPCISFEKNVLSDTAFLSYSSKRLVLINADFPQRKKLSKDVVAENDRLAAIYNPAGTFPFLVLIKPDKTVVTSINANGQTSEKLIHALSEFVK